MTQKPPDGLRDRDEELTREAMRAGEGDLHAFEQLVEQHKSHIVADCRYMTRDASSAEDLAQDIFVKAFFGLRSFEGRSSFRHWLQRIKVHHCLNHIKKQERKKQVALDDLREEPEQFQVQPAAHKDLEAMDDRQRIARILDSLPSTLRIALVMRDMDGLSYEGMGR